jgi:hypothetical protein
MFGWHVMAKKGARSMKAVMFLGVALGALAVWSPAPAKTARCLPAELIVAKTRAERPRTEILARLTGEQAAALLEAFSGMADTNTDISAGDEVTVLRNTASDEVFLIVAEEGCALWRAALSRSDYEHATWKAFGLPV